MKLPELLKSWCMGCLLVVLLLWGTTLHAAVPAAWKDTGFSINANGMTLRSVAEEFSRTYGVRLQMSAESDRIVKGRLKADNGIEFLNRLAGTYKFRWFVYNETLYVVPANDNTSARMDIGEDAVQDAKSALIGLGLFDDRFGWGELPDEGVVIVSGPRSYVELARGILLPEEKKELRKGKQIMLFRLKYATAMDRVINSRGKSETIPGIKTILSNLLFGPHSSEKVTAPGANYDADSRKRSRLPRNERSSDRQNADERFLPLFAAPGANGKNALTQGGGGGGDGGGDSRRSGSGGDDDGRPRIEADPTLNAIMIYDNINKKPMYASLIEQLDIQPQQIEIEALIVDIDRSKLSDMGVEWGVRAGAVNSTINSTMTTSSGTTLPLPGATLLISNAARFYARLKAMESNGEAHVLATPTVLTLDNVAAVLDLSRSAYVSLIGERVADMSDITAGTMLRVIPRIIHENGQTRVRLEVDIEDGSLDSSDGSNSSSGSNTNTGTIAASVTRSTISTQAIIDMQQTLMIGGYRAESLTKNKQKVPVLGDIPLVGGLFRSESQSTSTRERLFLITPRITGTDGVAANAMSKTTDRAQTTAREQRAAAAAAKRAQASEAPPPMSATPGAPVGPVLPVVPAAPAPATSGGAPGALPPGTPTTPTTPTTKVDVAATPTTAGKPPALAAALEDSAAMSMPMGGGVHVPVRVKTKCTRPSGIGML
ncbi:type III secretion outer membrane pore, YscC/HrcC family [Herbaspirillum sp. CF444]|uniref:type III secretion system outer membrane ring subunit SctC n=1 Tax=Herbaspirillum sp. CF444 TaxID=1144319 RepID=UPI00027268B4|nr:type III secretion system outer membrane ring subunit SctC [Herbaspirillum sp. CF444]EJL88965.1 type III secretion outer membrane pore, YscC/HrcC family [Herbaspirillum sp. CF444]